MFDSQSGLCFYIKQNCLGWRGLRTERPWVTEVDASQRTAEPGSVLALSRPRLGVPMPGHLGQIRQQAIRAAKPPVSQSYVCVSERLHFSPTVWL